jgi:hypothetical protein
MEVAALTIAIVDDLIKISERIAELISDARSFRDVSGAREKKEMIWMLTWRLLISLAFRQPS